MNKCGICSNCVCGYWYKDEEEVYARCHYPAIDSESSVSPCEQTEE